MRPKRGSSGGFHAYRLIARLCAIGCLLAAAGGCRTTPGNPDPWEKTNRAFYNFNEGLDRVALRPLSKLYVKVIPRPVREGIGNGFDNLGYLDVILNDCLQGQWKQGSADAKRMAINSTIGLAGFFDVATKWGLPAHENDFGITLALWGVKRGPYLVLPLFGPSTVRDAPGWVVSTVDDPTFWLDLPLGVVIGVKAAQAIDQRSRMEGLVKFRNAAALDPYIFTREGYLAYREHLIHRTHPTTADSSLYDDDESGPSR